MQNALKTGYFVGGTDLFKVPSRVVPEHVTKTGKNEDISKARLSSSTANSVPQELPYSLVTAGVLGESKLSRLTRHEALELINRVKELIFDVRYHTAARCRRPRFVLSARCVSFLKFDGLRMVASNSPTVQCDSMR